MAHHPDSKQPHDANKTAKAPEGDAAPVAVAGPEAQKRERPKGSPEAPKTEPEDPAPVNVAGPEAQAREKK